MTNLFLSLLIGLILFLLGLIFKLYPPKKINPWAGFRTRLAMSDQTLWDEANRLGSLIFIKVGLVSMALGLIFFLLDWENYFWVIHALTILSVIAGIFYINRHLKKFRKTPIN